MCIYRYIYIPGGPFPWLGWPGALGALVATEGFTLAQVLDETGVDRIQTEAQLADAKKEQSALGAVVSAPLEAWLYGGKPEK